MDKSTVEYWECQKQKAHDKIDDLLLGGASGVKSTRSGEDELIEHNLSEQISALWNYISRCDKEIEKIKEKTDKIGILYIERDQIYVP
jgi:hypothetical protein